MTRRSCSDGDGLLSQTKTSLAYNEHLVLVRQVILMVVASEKSDPYKWGTPSRTPSSPHLPIRLLRGIVPCQTHHVP